MDKKLAQERAWALYEDLKRISDRDPEQEVRGIAVPVIDAVLVACKEFVQGDPAVEAIDGLITAENVEDGSLRAVDACLVVHQLALAIGEPPTELLIG
ncbi:hypothetical protein [Nocardia sp. NPDC051832]|uniref:hypothetical protein n=1 Tax=Nocardia sp. NPDC051832 TaxID=3155673 RepID=UPI003422F6DA